MGRLNFNPRSPHGERRDTRHQRLRAVRISIHAPRTGSDRAASHNIRIGAKFQSTLPARGATKYCRSRTAYWHISIHAPRTGSDGKPLSDGNRHGISIHAPRTGSDGFIVGTIAYIDISIHAPRTGSDANGAHEGEPSSLFQSTLPARGATSELETAIAKFQFQSTLPARGATSTRCCSRSLFQFQSTLPARGATPLMLEFTSATVFQSTLPARGATVS